MRNLIFKLLQFIKKSLNGYSEEFSSTRLQSYIILFPILAMILVVISIEIFSFGHAIWFDKPYVLSNEFIITFGMILSHHLAILFSRKKSQSIDEIKGSSKKQVKIETNGDNPPTTDEMLKS